MVCGTRMKLRICLLQQAGGRLKVDEDSSDNWAGGAGGAARSSIVNLDDICDAHPADRAHFQLLTALCIWRSR